MKGILGRKVGMTQVFTDHGRAIAATIIQVEPNVVTGVFTKEKDGYTALQLAVGDKKEKNSNKPLVGHFKKAHTTAKRFVKEIRGMEGFELGSKIDASLFEPGEIVDVIGTSKGKGFAGAIKRHNQTIGPKSHGGGGGSQPRRQTGSLGDISGNKVVKGMTMPGQMGSKKATVQNLEVVLVDVENNLIVVKGSIPGPNKSFVVIRSSVKLLPKKEAVKLVNVHEAKIKNDLLEEAKKVGADVNTDMSIDEMKNAITAANEAKKAEEEAAKAKVEVEKLEAEKEKVEEAAEKAHEQAEEAKAAGDDKAAKEAEAKAEALEKQAEVIEAKEDEAKVEAKEADVEAKAAEAKAEELQVETEKETNDPTEEAKGEK